MPKGSPSPVQGIFAAYGSLLGSSGSILEPSEATEASAVEKY